MNDTQYTFTTSLRQASSLNSELEVQYFQQFAGFDVEPPERPCPPTLYEVEGFSVYVDPDDKRYIVDSPASDPIAAYLFFADAKRRADREAVMATIKGMNTPARAANRFAGGERMSKQPSPFPSEILDMLTKIGWRFETRKGKYSNATEYEIWDHKGEYVHESLDTPTIWFFYEKRILARLKMLAWNAKVSSFSQPARPADDGENGGGES